MLSSTCNTGPSSTLNFVYKVYGKIPLFILIGRIGLSLAKCRWWDAHTVLMECQSSLIIIIIIFQISCISPLIRSNHELKSSYFLFFLSHRCDTSNTDVRLLCTDKCRVSKCLFGLGHWPILRNQRRQHTCARIIWTPERLTPSRWHRVPVSSRQHWRDSHCNRWVRPWKQLHFYGDQPS